MKVLVCGGRDFSNPFPMMDTIDNVLGQLHSKHSFDVVMQGGANGADFMAKSWAQKNLVCVMEFPANWKHEGKGAGPHRNNAMLKYGQPDMVVAFPSKSSKGTWHMIEAAKKKGIPTLIFEEGESQ